MPQNSNVPDLYLDRFYHISLIYDVFVGSRRPLKISKGTVLHVRFIDYNVVNNIEYYTFQRGINNDMPPIFTVPPNEIASIEEAPTFGGPPLNDLAYQYTQIN
jgi:hypothetical protein